MAKTTAPPSESWLLARYKRCGDTAAREELTRRMMPLLRRVAGTYGPREHGADLEQVAALGLVKAIDRYDPAFGVPLRTYAIPTMFGEMRRYLRDHGWAMRVPRSLQERVLAITKASDRLAARSGHAPTVQDLAEEMDCTMEEVLEGLRAGSAYRAASLECAVDAAEDPDRTLADVVGVQDERLQRAEEVATLRSARDELNDNERVVLHLRFVEDLTQTEIARRVGVSQMQVSRILRRSLSRLQERLDPAA
jgi:RNA polymerase sigma-B factor